MLGLGGGILLVPAMVLLFDVPLEQAVPASLLCVVASSSGAAASHVESHLADVRLALSLELSTVAGALLGGLAAGFLAPAVIAVVFGTFMLVLGVQFVVPRRGLEPSAQERPQRYWLGVSGSLVAGGLSALLGVGGGPLKVPLMALGMRVPFKVASATSNLMIGVTAAASVATYAWRGQVNLALVAPLVVGVLGGAWVGSRAMVAAPTRWLKALFAVVLFVIAAQMLWKGGSALWMTR